MMVDNASIASRIVDIRKQTGLNQEQFYQRYVDSAYSGATAQGKQSKLETGRGFSLQELLAIADFAHISLDQLVRPESALSSPSKLSLRGVAKSLIQLYETCDMTLNGKSLIFVEGRKGVNSPIYDFLTRLDALYQLRKSGTLPEDSYRLAIEGHLKALPDEPFDATANAE